MASMIKCYGKVEKLFVKKLFSYNLQSLKIVRGMSVGQFRFARFADNLSSKITLQFNYYCCDFYRKVSVFYNHAIQVNVTFTK